MEKQGLNELAAAVHENAVAHSGSVVLSGYANEIYDNMLHDWKRIEKRALAERGQTRTEILWIKNAKGGEEP